MWASHLLMAYSIRNLLADVVCIGGETLLALSSYEFPVAHKTMQQFVVCCRPREGPRRLSGIEAKRESVSNI